MNAPDESYKLHEDNQQYQYLNGTFSSAWKEGDYLCHCLTSCRHLARRFIHSENRYAYLCEADEPEGCPKTSNRGVATKDCLTDPYEVRLGENNHDDGEFAEK